MARWSIRTGNSRLLVYREQRERDSTRTSYQAVSYVVLKVTLPDALGSEEVVRSELTIYRW